MQTLILYDSDFKSPSFWEGLLEVLHLPKDSKEIEVTVLGATVPDGD